MPRDPVGSEGLHSNEERSVTPDSVREALRDVAYPGLSRDIVSFGMVGRIAACGSTAGVELLLRTADATIPDRLAIAVRERLAAMGVSTVNVTIAAPPAVPLPRAPGRAHDPWADRVRLPNVRHVVAVGAGKGGVGKSTVAANLALAFAADGLRSGLLDADIYGPSLPIMLGIEEGARAVRMTSDKQIVPLEAHGIPLISFGFFLGEGSPAVWRGPMVSKAVKQFARGVMWPELDVLVVDLPPGTGDVPLSLAQAVEVSGAVVVTTPQRLAAVEARKAGDMFRALDVPLFGVVENMSGIFGHGGGATVADTLGVPFLGDVPFDDAVVLETDRGTPAVVARPASATALAMLHVARAVANQLGWRYEEHGVGA